MKKPRVKLPVHFRTFYGEDVRPEGPRHIQNRRGNWVPNPAWNTYDYTLLLCGEHAKNHQVAKDKQKGLVPWGRVTNKPRSVTCEDCLAVLLFHLRKQLDDRLAAAGGTEAAALERATTKRLMGKLGKAVGIGA